MKRCPACNRSFDDETLSFCLEDGTPLIRDSASRADSQQTVVTPSPSALPPETNSGLPVTQSYSQLPGKATVSAQQFNVPLAQGYSPATKQRRTWPRIVAIVALLLLVIAAVLMAIVVPPMLQAANSNNENRPQPTRTRSISTTTLKNETAKGTEVYEFTDKFVWRDQRWQAVASHASRVK